MSKLSGLLGLVKDSLGDLSVSWNQEKEIAQKLNEAREVLAEFKDIFENPELEPSSEQIKAAEKSIDIIVEHGYDDEVEKASIIFSDLFRYKREMVCHIDKTIIDPE